MTPAPAQIAARDIAPDPAANASAPTLYNGVAPVEGGEIILEREDFQNEFGSYESLGGQATVMPVRGMGYRLTALRPGSYLEHIGLRAGDIIFRIDGRGIHTANDAARAYAWLRMTDHFTVDVIRDGAPIQLRYRVTG